MGDLALRGLGFRVKVNVLDYFQAWVIWKPELEAAITAPPAISGLGTFPVD